MRGNVKIILTFTTKPHSLNQFEDDIFLRFRFQIMRQRGVRESDLRLLVYRVQIFGAICFRSRLEFITIQNQISRKTSKIGKFNKKLEFFVVDLFLLL